MDKVACQARIHRVAESRTWLNAHAGRQEADFMSDADTMNFQILKDERVIVGSGMDQK